MPRVKSGTKKTLWREHVESAKKEGMRAPIHAVNEDVYIGEWCDDKKHGKGTHVWHKTGAVYDGDWQLGLRYGFGTLSMKDPVGTLKKKYSGGWKNSMRHGYGTNFFSEEEHYEGEWYANQRSGWGRMHYADGSIYEGEWYSDQRNGRGLIKLLNGNRYEGMWEDDKKNGPGKFIYLNKGLVYTGNWKDDIAKCGTLEELGIKAPDPPTYPFPEVKIGQPATSISKSGSTKRNSDLALFLCFFLLNTYTSQHVPCLVAIVDRPCSATTDRHIDLASLVDCIHVGSATASFKDLCTLKCYRDVLEQAREEVALA